MSQLWPSRTSRRLSNELVQYVLLWSVHKYLYRCEYNLQKVASQVGSSRMFAELWPVSWSNQERSHGVGTRLGLDIDMQVWVAARVVIFTRHSRSALARIHREGKGAGWHLTPLPSRYHHVSFH